MTDLASRALGDFSDGGRTFPVYRKGTGPGVVIVHEMRMLRVAAALCRSRSRCSRNAPTTGASSWAISSLVGGLPV
jgi:hypothetical protein